MKEIISKGTDLAGRWASFVPLLVRAEIRYKKVRLETALVRRLAASMGVRLTAAEIRKIQEADEVSLTLNAADPKDRGSLYQVLGISIDRWIGVDTPVALARSEALWGFATRVRDAVRSSGRSLWEETKTLFE